MPPHAEDVRCEYPTSVERIEIPPKRKVPEANPPSIKPQDLKKKDDSGLGLFD